MKSVKIKKEENPQFHLKQRKPETVTQTQTPKAQQTVKDKS